MRAVCRRMRAVRLRAMNKNSIKGREASPGLPPTAGVPGHLQGMAGAWQRAGQSAASTAGQGGIPSTSPNDIASTQCVSQKAP